MSAVDLALRCLGAAFGLEELDERTAAELIYAQRWYISHGGPLLGRDRWEGVKWISERIADRYGEEYSMAHRLEEMTTEHDRKTCEMKAARKQKGGLAQRLRTWYSRHCRL